MNETKGILALLGACLPLFSALIWVSMISLSVHDSRTRLEGKIKKTILWYYIFMAVIWISLILYTYVPPLVLYLNIPAYLAYMLAPVQFYRYICELSETEQLKPFSLWHYILPVLIVFVLGIWSLFVPWDVQLGLVESRGQLSPEYPAYSRYFLSKPMMRLVFVIIYTNFSLVRLRRYYLTIGKQTDKHPKPTRWITGLIGFTCAILIITVFSVLVPREEIITSWLVLTISLIIVGEEFIIGYNVVRRNFLLYIPSVKERIDKMEVVNTQEVPVNPSPPADLSEIQSNPRLSLKLTKKSFENYIRFHKLWLDPDFKITDLVEPLKTSRTTLSNFINKTYGVNFNRYINRLRLAELDRLLALPSHAGKTVDDLFYKAGFASKRNYTRAKNAEQNDQPDKGGKHATNKKVVQW